jgi:hypothetical protein
MNRREDTNSTLHGQSSGSRCRGDQTVKRSRRMRVRLGILRELLYFLSVIAAVMFTHILLKLVVA